ncbi:MAG: hemin-degrading factor [Flavobacteriales bacterium]|nr:hemin-degrading factor [Flavobacteriales bacterium]
MITDTATDLKQRWDALLAADPKLRIRNAAAQLGVSEGELLATRLGDGVIRLQPDFKAILAGVPALGRVMALTRNDDVVHERKGAYLNPSLEQGPVGLFVGADIDLRIFWHGWAHAFAVIEGGRDGARHSLQFFGSDGEAVHKIYLVPESDAGAYTDLVVRFRAEDQSPPLVVVPLPAERPEQPDAAINVTGLRDGWLGLKDTHDFYLLLRQFGVSRTQALRLAPEGEFAVPVAPNALRAIITQAASEQCPIMVFVGNRGMLQIHTGTVTNLMDVPGWFNVVDPDFNLHMREGAIANSWIVRKPSVDGMITALECYDSKGSQLIQLFGKRKPGIPELEQWRALVAAVEAEQRLA